MTVFTQLSTYFEDAMKGVPRQIGRDLSVPIDFLNDLYVTKTREDVLGVYSVWSQRLVRADRCSIALGDSNDGLIITAMNGRRGMPQGTCHDVNNTVVGAVFKTGQPLFIPDVSQINLPDARIVQNMGYASAVIVPIASGGVRFGALSASFKTTLFEPHPVLAMLEAMGRCLATQLLVIDQMENLALMARTDALTGAFNRHHLYDRLSALWGEWEESGTPFSFLTLDLDYFKQINDRHGHDVGDAVLCLLVQRLKSKRRDRDVLIRMGGEEFGVLMTNTPDTAAIACAQRMRATIVDQPFTVLDQALPVTASFGVSQVCRKDTGTEDILKRADAALYAAKDAGRDKIMVARGDLLEPV